MLDTKKTTVATTDDYCVVINPPHKDYTQEFNIKRCEELMKKQNVTWDDLSALLDYPNLQTHCSSKTPMKNVINKIADLLECNVGYLMGANCEPYKSSETAKKKSNRGEYVRKNGISPEIDLDVYKRRLKKMGWQPSAIAAFCRLGSSSKVYIDKTINKTHFNNLLHCLGCSEEYLAGKTDVVGTRRAYIPEIGYQRYDIKISEFKYINGIPDWFLKEVKNGLAIPERAAKLLDSKLSSVRNPKANDTTDKTTDDTTIKNLTFKYKGPFADVEKLLSDNTKINIPKHTDVAKQFDSVDEQVNSSEESIPELLNKLNNAFSSMQQQQNGIAIKNARLKQTVEKLNTLDSDTLENILNVVDVMINNTK